MENASRKVVPFRRNSEISETSTPSIPSYLAFEELLTDNDSKMLYLGSELGFKSIYITDTPLLKPELVNHGNLEQPVDYNDNKHIEQIKALKNNPTLSVRGDIMDDGYKKLLDRLDQDIRDHKQEIRDRDERLQSEMQERERRIHEEAKEREERILAAIQESNKRIEEKINDIKESVNRAESRIDDTAKHVHSMVTSNFWGRVATIGAIIAICATVFATVWAAVYTTKSSSTTQQQQNITPVPQSKTP